MEIKEKTPLCACGCGKRTKKSKRHKKGNKFIQYHQVRNKNPMKQPEIAKKQSDSLKNSFTKKRPGTFYKMKHSKKTKLKISKIMSKIKLGKKQPRHSERMMGSNNPAWKGGISAEPYCQIWIDKEYKKDIKDRDGNKCQNPNCWKTSKKITIHHIDYNKKNCHPWNLITLCNSCNGRANKNREQHTLFYQEIMTEKHKYKYIIG